MTNEEQPYYRPQWQRAPPPSALPQPSPRLLHRRNAFTILPLQDTTPLQSVLFEDDNGQPLTPIHSRTGALSFFSNIDDSLERSESSPLAIPTAIGYNNDEEEWEEETKEEEEPTTSIPTSFSSWRAQ